MTDPAALVLAVAAIAWAYLFAWQLAGLAQLRHNQRQARRAVLPAPQPFTASVATSTRHAATRGYLAHTGRPTRKAAR